MVARIDQLHPGGKYKNDKIQMDRILIVFLATKNDRQIDDMKGLEWISVVLFGSSTIGCL